MARSPNNNNIMDFVFRTPKKLQFSSLYRYYFDFILRLLYRVILFEGIPETVDETFFKLILYTQGKITFFDGQKIDEAASQLLALNCSRAAEPTVYYIPRQVLVTNPRLKKSYMLTPGTDCEVIYLSEADRYNLSEINGGLFNLIERTATMLADNDISINIAQKNTRLVNLVSGDTQNTVDSIKAVIASMYEGDPTIVVKSSLIDKLQGVPIIQNSTNNNLIELIQVQQYIISHFYEMIGLTTHDQMKKERLITAEINDNIDLAIFNIDDILESIQEGLQRVNAMFGVNITARLNPIIEQQRQQREAQDAEPESDDTAWNVNDDLQNEELAEEEGGEPEEQPPEPEPEPEEEAEEGQEESEAEPEPEQEPEQETGEAAEEEPSEEGQEEEPEQAPEPEQNVEINIEGDNNTIIIQGGDELGSTDQDDVQDMGRDSGEGTGSDDE